MTDRLTSLSRTLRAKPGFHYRGQLRGYLYSRYRAALIHCYATRGDDISVFKESVFRSLLYAIDDEGFNRAFLRCQPQA